MISRSAVYERCTWLVVHAIHQAESLSISYPTSRHDEQRKIAKGFERRSEVGFSICGGTIDGMLVVTKQPTQADCNKVCVGARKFYCGQKGKFGHNMQAVCDADGLFLEVWIKNPASSSDYLAFIRSNFYKQLNTEGFLANEIALFGDNAYVQMQFMIVPYKGVRSGNKDNFNYYHSQASS